MQGAQRISRVWSRTPSNYSHLLQNAFTWLWQRLHSADRQSRRVSRTQREAQAPLPDAPAPAATSHACEAQPEVTNPTCCLTWQHVPSHVPPPPPPHAHKRFWPSSSRALFHASKEVTLGNCPYLLKGPLAFPSCTSSDTQYGRSSFLPETRGQLITRAGKKLWG